MDEYSRTNNSYSGRGGNHQTLGTREEFSFATGAESPNYSIGGSGSFQSGYSRSFKRFTSNRSIMAGTLPVFSVIRFRERCSTPGPLAKISPKKVTAIVNATLHTKPPNATHWSTRSMAKAYGVSNATVQRIWKEHNLKPHLIKTFKLSRDKCVLEKLYDVVGLYLNPPDKAIVFCVDEKSQIQALERTQPMLPLCPGFPPDKPTITCVTGQSHCLLL